MLKRLCLNCGVTCWHNKCVGKEREYRCTYCGHPANNGPAGSPKREYLVAQTARQATRARAMNIREV